MALSPFDFLTRWLLDRDAGGVYGGSDASGRRLLSTDKHLPDQASVVLALAHHGRAEDVAVALEGLLRMQDVNGNAGFCELTDRCWRPYPGGQVRTVRDQLHAATAMLVAAHRLDADEYRVRALDLINRCLELARDGQFPARLTADWRGVLGGPPTPQTAVSAIRALAAANAAGEPGVDADKLVTIAKRLAEAAGSATASHPPPWLRRCGAVARLAIALAHASRMLGTEEYVRCATSIMRTALVRFRRADEDGFWDQLAPDGSVRVDWIEAPRDGRSPFPVIRAADVAQVLLASQLLGTCGVDCSAVAAYARATLDGLADTRHGGVFLGKGFEWATASEPAATSAHLLWLPSAQPGVTVHGGLREMSLAQKLAHTQATVVRATATASAPAGYQGQGRRPPAVLGTRRRFQLPGLTGGAPEPARNWCVSEFFYLVASQVVLSDAVCVHRTLIAAVKAAQNRDGGFGERPDSTSSLASTYRAVASLRMAGELPARPRRAVAYLRCCQSPDGGFGPVPGMAPDVCQTSFAIAALNALDEPARPAERNAGFVLDCRTADGAYPERAGGLPSTVSTRRAVSTLLLLGYPVPVPAATVAWLQGLQSPPGGFARTDGGSPSLIGTYHAVAALALLGSAPPDVAECARWLHAQHGIARGDTHPAVAEDFAAAHARAILTGVANAGNVGKAGWLLAVG